MKDPPCESSQDRAGCPLLPKGLPWLVVFAWMAVIYYFSNQPFSAVATGKVLGPMNVLVRKIAHFLEYLILFVLWRRALGASFRATGSAPGSGLMAAIASILYACLDEWHQSFIPGRSAALSDVIIDSAGVVAGFLLQLALAAVRVLK